LADFRKLWKTIRRLTAADHELDEVAGKPVLISCRFDRDRERGVPFLSALSLTELEDGARPAKIKRMASAFEHNDLAKALAL
jgi:serine/threonine-protein kinase HipA